MLKLIDYFTDGEAALPERTADGVKGRTINLEVNLLRLILKRAKRWSVIADEVRNMPENRDVVGRVLTQEQKRELFRMASSKPSWMVAYCAAVIAVNSTCRKVELLNLRGGEMSICSSACFTYGGLRRQRVIG